ncbi:Peroxin 19 [Leishmania major strain Friedlin]|uniref:Peroxin 19 n=1 Tax=Leishmania major TaxID=5664 RepID=E9AFF0_LEIMA|nr:Peroxin 19 [Leishmania major strain Friedlin]CAG9582681.1 Peroxin_19 [Leishmania major strain Friedlin]CBZ12954.1 Peroxin 19 [Leishmania major strain Friedlin]|eukprot:XP_003722720.1 Peroxin 19 [Leishmania major strain Friedlin]
MSDGDLDALLDEAMDMVDEQERKHEEEVRVRDAKLEDDLQKALDESSGAAGGDADMMKMFMSMLGGAGSDDASLDSFKKSVMTMVSSLEEEENLGDEDKENLQRVKELVRVMEEEDIGKANDLLEQMKQEGKLPDRNNVGDAEIDEASRRCMEMLQQLSSATQGGHLDPAATPGAASSSSAAAAAAPAGNGAEIPAEVDRATEAMASALISTLADPQFVEPIKLMRDSYGPYMDAHRSELSQEDCERYDRQRAKAQEICDLLQNPISGAEDPRLIQLLELMNKYSELGDPPRNLVEYAPKNRQEIEECQ